MGGRHNLYPLSRFCIFMCVNANIPCTVYIVHIMLQLWTVYCSKLLRLWTAQIMYTVHRGISPTWRLPWKRPQTSVICNRGSLKGEDVEDSRWSLSSSASSSKSYYEPLDLYWSWCSTRREPHVHSPGIEIAPSFWPITILIIIIILALRWSSNAYK